MGKFRYWLPRILGIVFIIFLTSFSFDVFESGVSIWSQIVGFIIHSIPSIILIIVLVMAWHRPKVGGILYSIATIALASLVIWTNLASPGRMIASILLLVGPLCLTSILFVSEGKSQRN